MQLDSHVCVCKTLHSLWSDSYFLIYIYCFVCVTGQMCVALDFAPTVALDGRHFLEEISALFVSV